MFWRIPVRQYVEDESMGPVCWAIPVQASAEELADSERRQDPEYSNDAVIGKGRNRTAYGAWISSGNGRTGDRNR